MDVVFGEVTKTESGEVFVPVHQGDGRPMFKQLNGVVVEDICGDQITFNLQGVDMSSYDDDLLGAAKENRKAWFGREVKDTVLEKSYRPACADGRLVTTTIKDADGNNRVKCFNSDKEPCEFDSIVEGTVCSVVIELKRISMFKKTFEPEWFSVQVRTNPPPPPPDQPDPYDGYLFQDETDE